jgi:hypothetical protein
MIYSSRITSGYGAKLPAIAVKTFEFRPGLNILFGPNGCGKTTLLRVTAAFVGCYERGWSKPVADSGKPHTVVPYPRRFSLAAPGHCEAEVDWDGVPGMLHTVDLPRGDMFSDVEEEFDEQLAAVMTNPSAGQLVVSMINKLKGVGRNIPDITDRTRTIFMGGESVQRDHVNSLWAEYIDAFTDYVVSVRASGRKLGPVTVFIDEPDKALSIPNQHVLWTRALPGLAESCQVVAASHSPFALVAPGANVIEMEPGYVAACRECLGKIN